MRNSLIFKLMGAFLLVVAIGGLVISWLVSQATQNAFSLYTSRSGQMWAQRLAPVLADYYSLSGSWQGVDAILQSDLATTVTPGMGGSGNGNGTGAGRGMGAGPMAGGGMWGITGQRMILSDAQGIVLSDTTGELVGEQLSADQIRNSTPILVNDTLVGRLMVSPIDLSGARTPAGDFLTSINQSIITSAAVAGLIALLLGGILFFQITAPLRNLKKAAHAITQGDLNQRVAIRSHDELGELGETFNSMADTLKKNEIQRQNLVADIAHELRTPLAAIQATLEGMLDGVLPTDAEQVTALHHETMLLNRLVGDLRLLSLADSGELTLEGAQADLNELICQVVERSKNQAGQKNITLQVDIPGALPEIQADTLRITQVLNNLIGNALRYVPESGTIIVSARKISEPEDAIEVSVTDTGKGIPKEDLPNVFDRFYRADKSRTRASGGSGLGLAIVKQLVEAHGGKVEANSPIFSGESQQAYGTRISFTLPFHPPAGNNFPPEEVIQ